MEREKGLRRSTMEGEPAEEPSPPRWEWRADWGDATAEDESWVAYPERDGKKIEEGFQSGFSPFPIGTKHVVDFDARIQRRLPDPSRPRASFERERPVRRVPDAPFPVVLVVEVSGSGNRGPLHASHSGSAPAHLTLAALWTPGLGERDEKAVHRLRAQFWRRAGPTALV